MYSYETDKRMSVAKIDSILTKKEMKVLKLVAQGNNNNEIAELQHYSEGSVRNTVSEILQKLYLRDRTQLAIFAWKNNMMN